MKNMKVKIIAILLTLVLIGIFLLFFNRKPSIEMTPANKFLGIVRKLFSHFTLKNNDFSSASTRKMY